MAFALKGQKLNLVDHASVIWDDLRGKSNNTLGKWIETHSARIVAAIRRAGGFVEGVPTEVPDGRPERGERIRVRTLRGMEEGIVAGLDVRARNGWSANVDLVTGGRVVFSNAENVPWERV
jgi:hypothetical protein